MADDDLVRQKLTEPTAQAKEMPLAEKIAEQVKVELDSRVSGLLR